MLLLERQQYWMNDSLEKMYPLLKSIKQVATRYLERINQEKIIGRTISLDTIREVAEKLYKERLMSIRGVTKTVVSNISFFTLSEFGQRPFVAAAAEVMEITQKEHMEIVYPLRQKRIKMEHIRNLFNEEIYIALKKGDYAYVHRS